DVAVAVIRPFDEHHHFGEVARCGDEFHSTAVKCFDNGLPADVPCGIEEYVLRHVDDIHPADHPVGEGVQEGIIEYFVLRHGRGLPVLEGQETPYSVAALDRFDE